MEHGALKIEASTKLFGDGHGTVSSPGTANGDRKIRLAFRGEGGYLPLEHIGQVAQKVLRGLLTEHEVGHRVVEAREGSKGVVPVRIGQKATVQDQIDVTRKPEGVAK